MPDETGEPEATEKKRAPAVRDLKPSEPKGGAAKGGKSDKVTPRTEEVDFDWTLRPYYSGSSKGTGVISVNDPLSYSPLCPDVIGVA